MEEQKIIQKESELLADVNQQIVEKHQLSEEETLQLLNRIKTRSISDISKMYKGSRKQRRQSAKALKRGKK